MGLKANGTLLAAQPQRYLSCAAGQFRQLWDKTDLRNQSVGEGISSELAGIPYGHLHSSSWVLPTKPGAMSAFTSLQITVTPGSLNLAEGRNLVASTTITITVNNAQLNLIVDAVGSTTITFSLSATLAGALSAIGDIPITFTVNTSTLGAIVDAVASTLINITTAATIRADGELAGDITPFTPLSPQSLAAAVWEALAADYNGAGTMGNKLNSAASAGDPWSTALPGTYAVGEAGYILGNRVLTEDDINKIADIVLRRSTANIEASSDGDTLSLKSLYGMVAQGVHNTQVSGTSLTVTKSDDTTVLGTRTVTTDPSAEPIVGIDSD